MKIITATLLALSLASAASIAGASDLCDVAEADRQPIEALQSKLESDGWEVRNIKVDDGCYEAYAITAEGRKVEAYFDPASFELIRTK